MKKLILTVMMMLIMIFTFFEFNVYAAGNNFVPAAGVSANTVEQKTVKQSDQEDDIENEEDIETASDGLGIDGQSVYLLEELVNGMAIAFNLLAKLVFVQTVLLAFLAGGLIAAALFDHFTR